MDYTHVFGSVFGELTVVGQTGEKDILICRCSCGTEKTARLGHMRAGTVKSCGCLLLRRPKEVHGTHLLGRDPLYKIWNSMVYRCTEPSHHAFHRYGGRGITVCDRWLGDDGPINFIADMGPRPPGYSIDRIDNNKGYCRENCRWADQVTQSRNTSANRVIEFRGERKTLTEWASTYGLLHETLGQRLKRGWTIEKALTAPLRITRATKHFNCPSRHKEGSPPLSEPSPGRNR